MKNLLPPLPAFLLALLAVLTLLHSSAKAWNAAGHRIVAAIAFADLDQETSQAVIALLQAHPFFHAWQRGTPEHLDAPLHIFMQAATWPDEIRRDPRYHHQEWHYINLPFVPDNQPDVQPLPPLSDNMLSVMQRQLATLKHQHGSEEERAIALSWMLHLVGDVHQPLHCVALFSRLYPQGDRGGTRFYIRIGHTPLSLHAFWDGSLGKSLGRSARNRANALAAAYPRASLHELAATTLEGWAQESLVVAKEVAYRQGLVPGSPNKEDAPSLPSDYPQQAKKAAERRAALGGYRLADLVRAVTP